jgi:ATP-dependent DNA helicase RecG
VGTRNAERLARIGIHTVQDVLFHLPLRYQDRTRVVPIGALRPGDQAVIEGEIQLSDIKFGRQRMLLCRLSDGTGAITLRFFHFNAAQQQTLARGVRLRCYGEVRLGAAALEMIHPEYRRIDDQPLTPVEESLTPIYPTTEGLHQLSLRALTQQALRLLAAGDITLEEWLPKTVLAPLHLPSLSEAVGYVHYPPPDAPLALLESGEHPAQRRLAFEELLAHHLSLRQLRNRVQQKPAHPMRGSGSLVERLLQNLPFQLTAAQRRVNSEIENDLRRDHPMQRLLQGDVGSGKTLVAACAALHAIEAGYQAALMAPTELLAEQHIATFKSWFDPLGIEVIGLLGRLKGRLRRDTLENIRSGSAQLIVGTHALFQEGVKLAKLGLMVVDEQHRFGVHQRLALREKGIIQDHYPHQLIMTATPIPRTLTMIGYADLDSSVLDELPPGRTPVETVVVADARRAEVVERVARACLNGRQAYWVCTLIDESDLLQYQAAVDTATQLAAALPELRVGLVHGRMKAQEKEQVMREFKEGRIDVLVATTVIEVGVDVPNASLMIIENAERLGLAQLHQLRGRVGRGATASHCVLMYRNPLSEHARARVAALRNTNDGFEIARKDLELRGPGEVLGTRQTGMLQLHIADLARDQHLLPAVEQAATLLLDNYPERVQPLIRRWLESAIRYGEV